MKTNNNPHQLGSRPISQVIHRKFDDKKRIASQKTLRQTRFSLGPSHIRNEAEQTMGGCMRHLALRLFTPLLLTVLLLAGMGHAQFTDQVIKVNIPFDFEVGNMTFPAGMYSLVRTQPHILRLRNPESRVLATLVTGPVETATAPSSPKLDFYFEGGRH